MRFLTTEEVRLWCGAHGLRVTPNRFLDYDAENIYCFSVGLEDKPSRVIGLANYLVPTWGEIAFEGGLLWIRERVWGEYSEKIGTLIIEQMRLGKGETEPLETRPGHAFGSEELFEMHSYFAVPLLFGWDAFLIPEGKDYFLFVSHDGVVGVVSRTQETHDELYKRVGHWRPKEEEHWYLKNVGRQGDLLQGGRGR
jgi:hypothetical protein